jgi:hypothetical protein
VVAEVAVAVGVLSASGTFAQREDCIPLIFDCTKLLKEGAQPN